MTLSLCEGAGVGEGAGSGGGLASGGGAASSPDTDVPTTMSSSVVPSSAIVSYTRECLLPSNERGKIYENKKQFNCIQTVAS